MKEETRKVKEAVKDYLDEGIFIPLEKHIKKAIIKGDDNTFSIIKKYLNDERLVNLSIEDIESLTFNQSGNLIIKRKK